LFEFEPRLDDAGVLGYVQRSLAAGHATLFALITRAGGESVPIARP
jgi:hypothetical protein